jgi:glucose-6-phosphate 1-epimerase
MLSLSLSVTNTGDEPFSFTAALHTYLLVEDIRGTTIEGLHGIEYYDTVNKRTRADWVKLAQTDPRFIFTGEVDRVYCSVPGPLKVSDSKRTTTVSSLGFPDAVVWNPGPERAASLADLGTDGYRQMVCVEAAAIDQPVRLGPSETWQGSQVLSA